MPMALYSASELILFSKEAITDSRLPAKKGPLNDFQTAGKSGLNHPGYTDKMIEIKTYLEQQGYRDGLNYQSYRPGFVQLVRGDAVQTRIEAAQKAVEQIAQMDQPTLARFAFFMFREDDRSFNFMAGRAADGTLHAVMERAQALGPNKPAAPVNDAQRKLVAA